jgi:hypothetical protein
MKFSACMRNDIEVIADRMFISIEIEFTCRYGAYISLEDVRNGFYVVYKAASLHLQAGVC